MATRILSVMGDLGEFSKPVLERVIAEYEFTWPVNCLNCEKEKKLKIYSEFLNQIYVQIDEARECAILKLKNANLIECRDCRSIYSMIYPEPVFRRVFDIDLKVPRIQQLEFLYDSSNYRADLEKSRKQIGINFLGVSELF